MISVVLCNIGWTQNWIDLTKKYGSVCLWTKPVIGALYLLYGVFIAVHLMCIENDFCKPTAGKRFWFRFWWFRRPHLLEERIFGGCGARFFERNRRPPGPTCLWVGQAKQLGKLGISKKNNLGNLARQQVREPRKSKRTQVLAKLIFSLCLFSRFLNGVLFHVVGRVAASQVFPRSIGDKGGLRSILETCIASQRCDPTEAWDCFGQLSCMVGGSFNMAWMLLTFSSSKFWCIISGWVKFQIA